MYSQISFDLYSSHSTKKCTYTHNRLWFPGTLYRDILIIQKLKDSHDLSIQRVMEVPMALKPRNHYLTSTYILATTCTYI